MSEYVSSEVAHVTDTTPLADPIEEGERVIQAADEAGLTVRLIGGTAVWTHAETMREEPFAREYRDVDFVGMREDRDDIIDLMQELGYTANRRFNTMRRYRLEFFDEENDRKADYCIDRFEFCHDWGLRDRIELDHPTLPIEDLLLSKLQIYEPSDRDVRDIIAMLNDHPVKPAPDTEVIDPRYPAELCAEDWGLTKTVSMSMDRVEGYLAHNDLPIAHDPVRERLDRLRTAVEEEPKSLRWKLRSVIGERKKWYKEPELG